MNKDGVTAPATASPAVPGAAEQFVVGVMRMEVEGRDSDRFLGQVEAATVALDRAVTTALGLRVELLSFEGPHLTPVAGAYAPLDFHQIGLTEKLERGVHFLLIVTEVDLSASTLSYTLALSSQLTNVAVVSTKRLDPAFWGDDHDDDLALRRLTALLLHALGHLLNLPHEEDPANVMHDFAGVDDLAAMERLTDSQRIQMKQALPRRHMSGRAGALNSASCSGRSRATGGALGPPWRGPIRCASSPDYPR